MHRYYFGKHKSGKCKHTFFHCYPFHRHKGMKTTCVTRQNKLVWQNSKDYIDFCGWYVCRWEVSIHVIPSGFFASFQNRTNISQKRSPAFIFHGMQSQYTKGAKQISFALCSFAQCTVNSGYKHSSSTEVGTVFSNLLEITTLVLTGA